MCPTDPKAPRLIRATAVPAEFGIAKSECYRLESRGVRTVRLGTAIYFDRASLEALLERGTAAPSPNVVPMPARTTDQGKAIRAAEQRLGVRFGDAAR